MTFLMSDTWYLLNSSWAYTWKLKAMINCLQLYKKDYYNLWCRLVALCSFTLWWDWQDQIWLVVNHKGMLNIWVYINFASYLVV